METDQLKDIAESLRRISKILAGMLLRDIEEGDQKDKIGRLKQVGFDNAEIAEMLGTSSNTVKATVHSLKQSRKKRGKPAKRNKA